MSEDRGELAEVRRDLREMRFYIEDSELRADVGEWINETLKESDADTAEEFVESELNSLLGGWEMYHAPGLSRGEDGFPDRCSGCRHYGSACPVLLDNTEVRWRERELEEAETEQEARKIYQRQAIDVSCKVIPELLEEWDSEHSELIQRGQRLLDRVEETLLSDEDATDVPEPETETAAVLADGGDDDI